MENAVRRLVVPTYSVKNENRSCAILRTSNLLIANTPNHEVKSFNEPR